MVNVNVEVMLVQNTRRGIQFNLKRARAQKRGEVKLGEQDAKPPSPCSHGWSRAKWLFLHPWGPTQLTLASLAIARPSC